MKELKEKELVNISGGEIDEFYNNTLYNKILDKIAACIRDSRNKD